MIGLIDKPNPGSGTFSRLRSEFEFIKGNFLLLIISWLILDFCAELPGTYFPLYVKALGGTAISLGILGAAEMLARGLVQIPGGYIADKYGRKWIIMTMTAVAGLSRIIYVFAPSWEWLVLGAVVMGFTGIYGPALEAMIADSIPAEKRGMGFGLVRLIGSVSTTPSPLIAGFLYLRIGLIPTMRLSYGIATLGFLVAAVLRTRLRETLDSPEKINVGEMLGSYPVSLKESIGIWRLVPRDAYFLFVSNILTMFTIGMFMPVFTLFMVEDLGITEFQLSLIVASMFITMIIFALPTGKLVDTIGKKRPLLASYVLWAAIVPLFLYGNFWRLILAMTLVGVLQVLIGSAGAAWTADLVPSEHRGRVNGSTGFFTMIALSVGQLIGGWLYDNVSHSLPFTLQLFFMIPSFLIILLRTHEERPASKK
ncbi:MFS transporter [Candidatus Bathyarchaeota archaeon]|nr:MAG: MFS transporter [Candidatus Bathyarchaeota archaeon]